MSSSSGSVGVDGILIRGGTRHDNVAQRQVGAERVSKSKEQGDSSVLQGEATETILRPNQQRDYSGAASQVEGDRGWQEGDLLFAETTWTDQRDCRTKLMERPTEEVNNVAPSIRQGTFYAKQNTHR